MKALREAVEVGRRAQELSEAQAASSRRAERPERQRQRPRRAAARDLFEGLVKVEIGPLDDFSQLVGFEDAAGQIDATSEISVERFSEGRATLSMRLDEPIDLLRELEQRSPLDFRVRRTADDNLILDIDDDQPAPSSAPPSARAAATLHPLRRPGGVVTQRPAKPFTPVRFRWAPLALASGSPLARAAF